MSQKVSLKLADMPWAFFIYLTKKFENNDGYRK